MTDLAPQPAPDPVVPDPEPVVDPGLNWPTNDEVVPDEPVTPVEPEPVTPPVDEPVTPAVVSEDDILNPDKELPAGDTFPRAVVEKLRAENAERRVRTKDVDEVFEGWDGPAREEALDLFRALNDPERMSEVAAKLHDLTGRAFKALGRDLPALDEPLDPNAPMTQAQYDRMRAKEVSDAEAAQAQQDQAKIIEGITQEIKDLGYESGSPDEYALISIANTQTDGDLKAAHEKMGEWKQGIIDKFVEEQRAAGQRHLTTQPALGTAPADHGDPPASLKEARKALEDLIDASPS